MIAFLLEHELLFLYGVVCYAGGYCHHALQVMRQKRGSNDHVSTR